MTTGNDGARAGVELTEADVAALVSDARGHRTRRTGCLSCVDGIERLVDRLRQVEAERDAYRKAKQENDERFQIEAAEQRERADKAEAERDPSFGHEVLRDRARQAEVARDKAEAALAEARQREERVRALNRPIGIPDGNGIDSTPLEVALFSAWVELDANAGDYEAGTALAEAAWSAINTALGGDDA